METEVENYYRTKQGDKAYVEFESQAGDTEYVYVGYVIDAIGNTFMRLWKIDGTVHTSSSGHNLVALWEDEAEEIDISQMYIAIQEVGGMYFGTGIFCSLELIKEEGITDMIAIVTVKDWQDIQQGKRKLIVGEGL